MAQSEDQIVGNGVLPGDMFFFDIDVHLLHWRRNGDTVLFDKGWNRERNLFLGSVQNAGTFLDFMMALAAISGLGLLRVGNLPRKNILGWQLVEYVEPISRSNVPSRENTRR